MQGKGQNPKGRGNQTLTEAGSNLRVKAADNSQKQRSQKASAATAGQQSEHSKEGQEVLASRIRCGSRRR